MTSIPVDQSVSNVRYSRIAYKGYSQRIFREFPHLTNVCLAFYNYPICSYAVSEDKKRIKKTLAMFRSCIVDAGLLDEDDMRWQYVFENRERCMAHTASICNLVERTVKELEADSKNGDLDASRTLRTLTTYYGVKTSQPEYSKRTPLHAIDAFQCIFDRYGVLYDSLFMGIHAPSEHGPMLHDIFCYSDFYHHTRDLLSYYKQYTVNRVNEELAPVKQQQEKDVFSELMGNKARPNKKALQKTTVATCAAMLVEHTLNALKEYDDESRKINGIDLFRSIDQHYLTDVALTKTFTDVLKDTKGWKSYETIYERKELALRTYSAILWGYHTLSVMEVLDERAHHQEKKKVSSGKLRLTY